MQTNWWRKVGNGKGMKLIMVVKMYQMVIDVWWQIYFMTILEPSDLGRMEQLWKWLQWCKHQLSVGSDIRDDYYCFVCIIILVHQQFRYLLYKYCIVHYTTIILNKIPLWQLCSSLFSFPLSFPQDFRDYWSCRAKHLANRVSHNVHW